MARIEGEIVIDRPPAEVFDFVADERNEPRFNEEMVCCELVSEGRIGLGSQFRAEVKTMGRTTVVLIEFTTFERPQRLGSSSETSGMVIEGELTFEPVPEGTRMRWQWQLTPRDLLKLATPLIARIGWRQEERIWASLKRVPEE